MDTHNILRHPSLNLTIPSLCVGIDSDLLYPAAEVKALAKLIGAEYQEIHSPHGHDAFLVEMEQVQQMLKDFL
jgi:homoserine O-acetyltransferase/O-succinyltransferase